MDFSLVERALSQLPEQPGPSLTILEAETLRVAHVPPYAPDMPSLILGLDSPDSLNTLKTVLLTTFPSEHQVYMVTENGARAVLLSDLEFSVDDALQAVYVTALSEGTSFEAFAEVVAHLRAPNGCPWDREQTHESLRKHLLEEAYEAIAAIDSGDVNAMREEFGDLLLQVVLQSQIANEEGHFNINQVIQGINAKLVRRHPHVFGDLQVDGVDGVLANWEKLKEQERSGKPDERGLLDGVPLTLPALSQAQEYQDRAARVGFDWPGIEGVLDKVREEIEEVKNAETDFELAAEIGDLLFALVNVARWKKVDAESVLRGTNTRFKKRLAYVEKGAKAQGRPLSDLSLEEMEILWQAAKQQLG